VLTRVGDSPESLDARLEEMVRKMERLRALYESFFMGIERTPPNIPRRELNRLMVEMQQSPISNATLRFKFQSLTQRWVLYTTYWNRTLQEIEAGTYRRDLARARRHISERGGAITEQEALALGIPANRVKAFVGRHNRAPRGQAPAEPAAAVAPAPAAPAAPAAAAVAGGRLDEAQLQAFFRKYSEAHMQALGTPPRATLDQLRGKLDKLLAGQPLERVELDVSVEDGKIKVRARPRR
jgi:hypothetical protein